MGGTNGARPCLREGGKEMGACWRLDRVIKERVKGLQEVESHRCIFDGEERLALERCIDAFERHHVGVDFRLQQVLVVLISLITT
jgi:hypothetical protein